jgi:hypothetical protein
MLIRYFFSIDGVFCTAIITLKNMLVVIVSVRKPDKDLTAAVRATALMPRTNAKLNYITHNAPSLYRNDTEQPHQNPYVAQSHSSLYQRGSLVLSAMHPWPRAS